MDLKELVLIREAEVADAHQVCDVLRTSIIELCEQDHRGNQKELDDWLENKTVQNCEVWIKNERTNLFVAESNGRVVGVSSINHDGNIGLCYILPEVKGQGLGGQLLEAAEKSVLGLGIRSFSLESTITAKGFYEYFGYTKTSSMENCLEYEKPSKP